MNKHHFDTNHRWRYKNRLVTLDNTTGKQVWFRVLRTAYQKQLESQYDNFVARQYQEAENER